MEGGQAVDEPGLLLPDGDPGIVLLGVNQSGLGTLNMNNCQEKLRLSVNVVIKSKWMAEILGSNLIPVLLLQLLSVSVWKLGH